MKTKLIFKQHRIVIVFLLLLLAFAISGDFDAYAINNFSNYPLSLDGNVKASYSQTKNRLTITGHGKIERDKWISMARKFEFNNYRDDHEGWDGEEDFDTHFINDAQGKIKLPTCSEKLFCNYDEDVYFNDAVDTSDVTDMSYMFRNAISFNQPVNFDTSNVYWMGGMFWNASSFNQPVNFDTSKVTKMNTMFCDAKLFNQPVAFDTSNAETMSHMFWGATKFNQPVNFDTSKVTIMSSMFNNAESFSHPIFFDISSLQYMDYMFFKSNVTQVIFRNGNNNQNINAENAFKDCLDLRYLSFSGLTNATIDGFSVDYRVKQGSNTSEFKPNSDGFNFVDNLPYRVYPHNSWEAINGFLLSADGGVTADHDAINHELVISGAGEVKYDGWAAMAQLINQDFFSYQYSWGENVNQDNMKIIFSGSPKAIKLCGTEKAGNGLFGNYSGQVSFNDAVDIAPGVTDLSRMFFRATQFNEPVDFNTAGVENMQYMFFGATSFNQPVSFNTASVTDMSDMFYGATSFNKQISFDTGNVTDMSEMFAGATTFNKNINFNTQNVVSFYEMFAGATDFNQSVRFNISSAQSIISMFYNSAVKGITFTNSAGNQDVDATTAFNGCDDLNYLKFSGLKNATLEGFSGDYYVRENDGEPVAKTASSSYSFTDNANCRVYLQSRVPHVALSGNGSGIKVSWTAVAGATGYEVFRADKNSGPFTKVKTLNGLFYTNYYDLVAGMPYFYKVRHYKKYGPTTYYGEFSEIKGYYAPGALATPAKPSLTLDKNGSGIRLNWNSQDRIIGYQVFRSLSPDKPFSYLQTSSGNATKYTNLSGLTPGRPFYYKVRAYRMAKGVRAYSPFSDIKGMFAGTDEYALGAVSFSLEDNPSVSAPNVRVRWTGVSGADGYCVYRWNSAAQNWIGLKKTGPNARVYTNINGVANHKTNFYGMRTYHISGGTTYYGNIGQSKGFRVDK